MDFWQNIPRWPVKVVLPMQPLTHHEILGLVEPYSRRGRRLDLASSNRLERRLLFKPVDHAGDMGGNESGTPALREDLRLENPEPDKFLLTRVLTLAGGLQATLEAEGTEPGELLARIEAVAPLSQFRAGPGYRIALSQRAEAGAGGEPEGAAPVRVILKRGEVDVAALRLTLRVPVVKGISGEIEVLAAAGDSIELPEDLLAVLGWDWGRLARARDRWRSNLRLRGLGLERSRDAEGKLEALARHLARTLAEPPNRFHQRLLRQRWGVAFRRSIPLLVCAGLIGGAAVLPQFDIGQDSMVRLLIFHTPPLLLALSFSMRELPRIELPPWPRSSFAPSWRKATPGAEAAPPQTATLSPG
jgi:hypothetical protein